jgi:hypothetical protein
MSRNLVSQFLLKSRDVISFTRFLIEKYKVCKNSFAFLCGSPPSLPLYVPTTLVRGTK